MKYPLNIKLSDDCIYTIDFSDIRTRDKADAIIQNNQPLLAMDKLLKLRYKSNTPADDFQALKNCVKGLLIVFQNENGLR